MFKPSGLWPFRQRVPSDLQGLIGQRIFKQSGWEADFGLTQEADDLHFGKSASSRPISFAGFGLQIAVLLKSGKTSPGAEHGSQLIEHQAQFSGPHVGLIQIKDGAAHFQS